MLQLIPNKYWSTPDIWDKTELTTTVALKFTRSLNFLSSWNSVKWKAGERKHSSMRTGRFNLQNLQQNQARICTCFLNDNGLRAESIM